MKLVLYNYLLLSLGLVGSRKLVEELTVHLHEGFEHIVHKSHNCLVPVLFADAIQSREHNRHYHMVVLLNQTHYVLIIPEVQCTLSHLKTHHNSMKILVRCSAL